MCPEGTDTSPCQNLFLLGRESSRLVACVAARLGFAKATAAKGYASTTVNFLARAIDHFDIALHE
jgi:hypothetical protein